MKEIRDYLNVNERFNRSIRLERDFFDPLAVGAYVITEEVSAQVNRLFEGLDPRSGQRAWRITGDYGSGKSSFALLLAHLFKGDDKSLPSSLWAKLDQKKISTYKRKYLNVLITGSRIRSVQKLRRHLLMLWLSPFSLEEKYLRKLLN